MIIFLKRPAFHSEHFHFSEHEKRKDQNNLKPHYKIAPKGAGLPYQICEVHPAFWWKHRHKKADRKEYTGTMNEQEQHRE